MCDIQKGMKTSVILISCSGQNEPTVLNLDAIVI